MTSIYTMVVRCVGILVSTAATYYLAVRVISHANALGEKDKDFEEWRQAYGELLDAVQRLKLFRDSKSFVDMPMKLDPEDIMAAFRSLPRPLLPQTLSDFVAEHFLQPGSDVIPYPLPSPEIVGLNWIEELNGPAKSWAMDLIKKWAQLTRKTAPSVSKNPERTSTLHRRHVFVVPGGRFRESYYWDSYWIVKGLIISGLGSIAKGVVKNLLDDVHKFGFVPNGGRIYYATRSQPPLLCSMVREVYESSDDKEFLSSALRTLEIDNGVTVELNRYYSKDNTPRPESYREDLNTSESPHIFREIRSAAESGWDFSSRWILNKNQSGGYSLKDLAVTSLAPVDLNAFLYSMESSMSHLYSVLGNTHASGRFSKAAVRRKNAIMKVMAHGSPARFFDVDIKTGKPSPYSTAAEYTIMWAGLLDDWDSKEKDEYAARIAKSTLLRPAGISTTEINSGQQWDMPNSWPPLQELVCVGLQRLNTEYSQNLARSVAERWLRSNYKAWKPKGYMFEKYNAIVCGKGGQGGEYQVQVGFGWSNGVALQLMKLYPDVDVTAPC